MRNWDNWDSYLDNDGNLLHGKVRFCKQGTTENIIIKNSDGIPLANPILTDILGRTEYQVFLDTSEDVSAYFYKYIGSGEMNQWPPEDYDPSRWAIQYESTSVDPVAHIDIEADGAIGVNTMADLRALDPDEVPSISGAKLVWLYGYYAAGDTSPVMYMWNPSSHESDDGGASIQASSIPGQGRWILVSRELHFDVRHFGIFPTDDIYSTDTSYTSQIANCSAYLDKVGCDAWFPALKGDRSFYLFDGSNTFSIKGDIYVSDDVRFQCKNGTTGTIISCHELHKRTKFLFTSEVHTGQATLRADWVNISWVGGQVAGDARVGWVIDSNDFARTITGKEVKFIANGNRSLQLDNCQISSNHCITGDIVIMNSILKTEFFADDYDWSNLSSYNNTILLVNCKDANTYVLLKNKQGEADYGSLGEQELSNTTLLAGAIAENATFTNVTIQGACELHNVSGTVTVSGSGLELNAVDCWLTLLSSAVASSVAIRRGSLGRNGDNITLQVLSNVFMDNVNIYVPMTTLGADTDIRNSEINGEVTATDIKLTNCQVRADVDQRDVDGVLTVACTGNMFHDGAQHYVHATTVATKVVGVWSHNGSSYDNKHWIRLDRTNLRYQDNAHEYTYAGNSEPYLSKWSGRNRPMKFKTWGGHWSSSAQGTGAFSTTTIPFLFYNNREREVTVVPRQNYWKMFTVGRGYLCRSGHIQSTPLTIGIMEGDYSEHTNGQVPLMWTWGCKNFTVPTLVDGQLLGAPVCVSRDGDGVAEFVCSFEQADTDHTGSFSYGVQVGFYPSNAWDSGSWETTFPVYPATPKSCTLFVFIDPDFTTGTNPQDLD